MSCENVEKILEPDSKQKDKTAEIDGEIVQS